VTLRDRIGWYARLMDAALTEAEFARWQRLQAGGLSAASALSVVLRARVEPPTTTEPLWPTT